MWCDLVIHFQTKVVVPPTVQRVPSKDVKDVYTYGPWGGAGGTVFDDSTYDGIRQIRVKRNVAIVSIKVCYDFKGEAVWGSKNGGSGSFKKDLVSKTKFKVSPTFLVFMLSRYIC